MNYTSNYKLNLPEGRDVVEISKLNDNFTKLDSTVKTVDNRVTTVDNRVTSVSSQLSSSSSDLQSSIDSVQSSLQSAIDNGKPISGTFTGDGTSSRTVNLGFRPSVLLLLSLKNGMTYNSSTMATSSTPGQITQGTLLSITSSGFTVYCVVPDRLTNISGYRYLYVAWK